jgi:hypothetical protein
VIICCLHEQEHEKRVLLFNIHACAGRVPRPAARMNVHTLRHNVRYRTGRWAYLPNEGEWSRIDRF